jgi:HD superfamily phosphohydrolase YqeK
MNAVELHKLKHWFSIYTNAFLSSDTEDQKNIELKIEHSFRVHDNIVRITDEQHMSTNEAMLAEIAGLFHDIGRFYQYKKYKTFNDIISVNHGKLGADVLDQQKVLENIDEDEQSLILDAVRLHNVFKLPVLTNEKKMFFLKLVRDADKLDIWRVFDEYYEKSVSERATVAAHGLPDEPECSDNILSSVLKNQSASMKDVKSLNDFKLLQLSWIYDLHFNTSYRLLLERDYINKYTDRLPDTAAIRNVSFSLCAYAEEKAREPG